MKLGYIIVHQENYQRSWTDLRMLFSVFGKNMELNQLVSGLLLLGSRIWMLLICLNGTHLLSVKKNGMHSKQTQNGLKREQQQNLMDHWYLHIQTRFCNQQ